MWVGWEVGRSVEVTMLEHAPIRSARDRRLRSGLTALIALALLTWSAGAGAQDAARTAARTEGAASAQAPAAGAQPSLNDLKAAAFDAQERARKAEAAAAEASEAAEAARRAIDEASGQAPAPRQAAQAPAPAPSPKQAEGPAGGGSGQAGREQAAAAEQAEQEKKEKDAAPPDPVLEDLHRATEEAKNAAAAARAATAALQEHVKERKNRFSRNGLYLSGGIFWSPELFDTTWSVDDSRGAFGAIGYHLAERFEIEARFDILDDFDAVSPTGAYTAKFNGWTGTLNGRIFILTNTFQPYLGMGIGVMDGETEYLDVATGLREVERDTVATFRVSAGFDFYVSESLALTADAAVNMPGGDLNFANYATLGGGIKLRF